MPPPDPNAVEPPSPLAGAPPDRPLELLDAWLAEARAHPGIRNADAIALATADAGGVPQVRYVLARGLDPDAARLTFYTNYRSAKGRDLVAHPRATAAYYWDPLGRQARLTGRVTEAEAHVSDAYFASRPRDSQLAAWASEQSEPVESRAALEAQYAAQLEAHGETEPIPRPPHWGGFHLEIERIELWVDRWGRLHDRIAWTRRDGAGGPPRWAGQRLQP